MKDDLKTPIVAKVDLHNVQYVKPKSLGIDFSNQIDVWSRMEFRYREKIKNLCRNKKFEGHDTFQNLNSLIYAIREKID